MLDLLVTRGPPVATEAEQGLESCPRPAAVGPEDKLVEVDLELCTADSVMSSDQPVLEIADHPIGERNDRLGASSQTTSKRLGPRDVPVTGGTERLEALESVREDRRASGDISGYKVADRGPGEVRNDLHSNPACCSPAP